MIPSLISFKYGIKLLWNSVGVFGKFDGMQRNTLRTICSQVDYISVRNEFSKESLVESGIVENRISVTPDTALKIYEHYTLDYLNNSKHIMPVDKYIVFHSNRFISDEDKEEVIKCLRIYADKGYQIILLPLAYTHGDEELLQEIAYYDSRFFMFNEKLSMIDMMYILANCELYIGVSFHGAITALEYGNKAIALDYMNYYKTRDLFKYFNLEEYYLNDTFNLDSTIKKALAQQEKVNMKETSVKLNEHFDRVYNEIINNKENKCINNQFSAQLIDSFINSYDISQKYISELRSALNMHINKVNELNEVLAGYQTSDKEKTEKVNELNEVLAGYQASDKEKTEKIIELHVVLEGYQKSDRQKVLEIQAKDQYIKELEDGIKWHIECENNKDEEIDKQKKDISRYCSRIFEMENNFWWKLGKLFNKKM